MWKLYVKALAVFWASLIPNAGAVWIDLRPSPRNVADLRARVDSLSDPTHVAYGKHLSYDEVKGFLRAEAGAVDAVFEAFPLGGCSIVGYGDAVECPTVDYETARGLAARTGGPLSGALVVDFKTPRRSLVRGRAPRCPVNHNAFVVPEVYRRQYAIPSLPLRHGASAAAIEFQSDMSFNFSDLKMFCDETATYPCDQIPRSRIIGPFNGEFPDVEASLDVQVLAGAAPNATLFYATYTGWILQFATDMAARLKLGKKVPTISSLSWGWSESDQCNVATCNNSTEYVSTTNRQLMALAAQGLTVVAASGDAGANGRTDEGCVDDDLLPIFPGSSDWVTSVGGTFLDGAAPERDPSSPFCAANVCAASPVSEQICSYDKVGWTSGGGFSNLSPRPSHQDEAVAAYLRSARGLPPSFSRTGRGYPDVALVAHNFAIFVNGYGHGVDGTSASAPLFAAVVARLNDARAARNQPSVGFAGPFLYGAAQECASCFNRFGSQKSSNKCTEMTCQNCIGFNATSAGEGMWDPVFGLGATNVTALLRYDKKLWEKRFARDTERNEAAQ